MESFFARLIDQLAQIKGSAVFGPNRWVALHVWCMGSTHQATPFAVWLFSCTFVTLRNTKSFQLLSYAALSLASNKSHGWSHGGAGNMVVQ